MRATIPIPPSPAIVVLSVGSADGQHLALESIFSLLDWTLHSVSTVNEALAWMRQNFAPVIISECDLSDGNWRVLLREALKLPSPPRFIGWSRLGDERLWTDVLSAGGYDVLSTPFVPGEVFISVRVAWESWHGQWDENSRPLARKAAAGDSNLPPAA